ncbi:thiamine pyrophosphate-dependent enzyme [Ancylomarina longa]|uniref:2-oxoglutarate oxidoreductase n=1 Tax=Ancylomarina longa TaxID=2487017 RepID=A0A434AW75_9BACT|nr:thiamine pyrophosphate-dependent enzyme [Ancylomarina longa]RUT78644.1 2-oxoglutarate oxidoreductase [Ancylomarina longa]
MTATTEINKIINEDNLVYKKTNLLLDNEMHYCPGCTHGVIHKVIAEVIDEMDIQNETIGVSPVGCSVLAYNYIDIDWQEAAHGRAPALATATSRLMPEKYVFTYQGDGDLASIGCAEIIHACNRGENIVVFFVNNAIYGMTGGQMAPTTLEGQVTATTPYGRNTALNGHTMKITEMIALLPGTRYVTRQSAETPAAVRKLKKAVRKAFENTTEKKGLSFIEIVGTCSSGWKLTPTQSNEWMKENMFPFYQLGTLKDE